MKILIIIASMFLLSACYSKKNILIQGPSTIEDAIQNAVVDFSISEKKIRRKYDAFTVMNAFEKRKLNWAGDSVFDFYHIIIFPEVNKYLVDTTADFIGSIPIEYFPTKITLMNDKAFLLFPKDGVVTDYVVQTLKKINLIDSTNIKIKAGILAHGTGLLFKWDENVKGVNYFICKNDVSKMKKIKSSKAINRKEQYDGIDCECKHSFEWPR